ncbi:heterokaryon incompatibility protein-domain-containing protein [Podospora conica]|nr:heterokaryon incompatibility protein-domain-containing protein [Schizothecium conicum]
MWLINTATLSLEYFLSEQAPPYAILSHTWGDGEVSLAEFQRLDDQTKAKPGFEKIEKTCELAKADGITHVWIDTCCIDKTSSAELSEAINSMYSYYSNAKVCFAYLSDWDPDIGWQDLIPIFREKTTDSKSSGSESESESESEFESGIPLRWFTRGWTLQELIAPSDIRFFDSTWSFRGTKTEDHVLRHVSRITGIDRAVLSDGSEDRLHSTCLAQRMSWASSRTTTRTEDIAYCLLGIFQINMPLLYGEGDRAFIRLQEEIIKKTTDLSILAWFHSPNKDMGTGSEILSSHPRQFRGHTQTTNRRTMFSPPEAEMAMTNKGLRIRGRIHARINTKSGGQRLPSMVHLDTGCFSPREGGYTIYWVFLGSENQDTNTYRRESTVERGIDRGGPAFRDVVPAGLHTILIAPSERRSRFEERILSEFGLMYNDGRKDDREYYNRFKQDWPPKTTRSIETFRGRGYWPGRLVSLHPSHPTMGYVEFELRTNSSTQPLVEFLALYKCTKSEREVEKMWVYLAMGKTADEIRARAAEIEKMEPWPAEDALREYLERLKETGRLRDELNFLHGKVGISVRIEMIREHGYNFPDVHIKTRYPGCTDSESSSGSDGESGPGSKSD